jgi:hypothetical protein
MANKNPSYTWKVRKSKTSEIGLAIAILRQFINDIRLAGCRVRRRQTGSRCDYVYLQKTQFKRDIKAEVRSFFKNGNKTLDAIANIAGVDHDFYRRVIKEQAERYGLL